MAFATPVGPGRRWGSFAALGLAWTGLAIAILAAGIRPPDDMYITFRYAWNLAHGNGFVFNPGEHVFGLTNPGLGLTLALLQLVTRVPVHELGRVLFGAGLVTLTLLLWWDAADRAARLEAAVAGTLVIGCSAIWISVGSASAVVLALLAGSALLVHRRPGTAGVLAGLAVWFRPDAALGATALGVLAWLERRRAPWRWGLVTGGVILLGVVAAWLYFGSPLPNTLVAKRIVGELNFVRDTGPVLFWARATLLFERHMGRLWLFLVALGVGGQWPLFVRGGRATRTVVLYAAGVAVAYPLMGVPFYHWYVVPTLVTLLYGMVALAAGIGRGLGAAVREAWPDRGVRLEPILAAVLAVAILFAPARSELVTGSRLLKSPPVGGRFDTYRRAGLWIRAHSQPGDRIAYGEIGNLAYWSRRPVDDLMGLVTPRSLPYLAAHDAAGAFLADPPELFVRHPQGPQRGLVNRPWFQAAYELVASIPDSQGEMAVTIYRRRLGVALPPPRPPIEHKAEPPRAGNR
jgi:hypothetical protein